MKYVLSGLAAFLLMGVVLSSPAEASCWWNGWRWVCGYHGSRDYGSYSQGRSWHRHGHRHQWDR